jgi:hypothetical protein
VGCFSWQVRAQCHRYHLCRRGRHSSGQFAIVMESFGNEGLDFRGFAAHDVFIFFYFYYFFFESVKVLLTPTFETFSLKCKI